MSSMGRPLINLHLYKLFPATLAILPLRRRQFPSSPSTTLDRLCKLLLCFPSCWNRSPAWTCSNLSLFLSILIELEPVLLQARRTRLRPLVRWPPRQARLAAPDLLRFVFVSVVQVRGRATSRCLLLFPRCSFSSSTPKCSASSTRLRWRPCARPRPLHRPLAVNLQADVFGHEIVSAGKVAVPAVLLRRASKLDPEGPVLVISSTTSSLDARV
jgi:hypothetical protein